MKPSLRIAAGTLTTGLAVSTLVGSDASAHLNNFYWSAGGHTLQNGSQSNMVGFWQAIGYTQGVCPGGFYDGIYGPNTVQKTIRMQQELATPGTSIPATGIVNAATWNGVQGAWFQAIGTPNNFQRLQPLGTSPGSPGNYYYYGGASGNVDLAWGNSGGPIWKFKVPGTNSWFDASSSRTMGSFSAC